MGIKKLSAYAPSRFTVITLFSVDRTGNVFILLKLRSKVPLITGAVPRKAARWTSSIRLFDRSSERRPLLITAKNASIMVGRKDQLLLHFKSLS